MDRERANTRGTVSGHEVEALKVGANNGNILFTGYQPHSRMPEIWSVADIVVLPQRSGFTAMAQVPGKVFEAMAMAKPILATRTSDPPEILSGCGWIAEPNRPEDLAACLEEILDRAEEARSNGERARERCIARYSWDAMEKILLGVFAKYV